MWNLLSVWREALVAHCVVTVYSRILLLFDFEQEGTFLQKGLWSDLQAVFEICIFFITSLTAGDLFYFLFYM